MVLCRWYIHPLSGIWTCVSLCNLLTFFFYLLWFYSFFLYFFFRIDKKIWEGKGVLAGKEFFNFFYFYFPCAPVTSFSCPCYDCCLCTSVGGVYIVRGSLIGFCCLLWLKSLVLQSSCSLFRIPLSKLMFTLSCWVAVIVLHLLCIVP